MWICLFLFAALAALSPIELTQGVAESVTIGEEEIFFTFTNDDCDSYIQVYFTGSPNTYGFLCVDGDENCGTGNGIEIYPGNEYHIDPGDDDFGYGETGTYYIAMYGAVGATATITAYFTPILYEDTSVINEVGEDYEWDNNDSYRWYHLFVCPDNRAFLEVMSDGGLLYVTNQGGKPIAGSSDLLCDGVETCSIDNPDPGFYEVGFFKSSTSFELLSDTWSPSEITLDEVLRETLSPYELCADVHYVDLTSSSIDLSLPLLVAAWSHNHTLEDDIYVSIDPNEFAATSVTEVTNITWYYYEDLDQAASIDDHLHIMFQPHTPYVYGIDDVDNIEVSYIASQALTPIGSMEKTEIEGSLFLNDAVMSYISFSDEAPAPYSSTHTNPDFDYAFSVYDASDTFDDLPISFGVNFNHIITTNNEGDYDFVGEIVDDGRSVQVIIEESNFPISYPVGLISVWSDTDLSEITVKLLAAPVFKLNLVEEYSLSIPAGSYIFISFEPEYEVATVDISCPYGGCTAQVYCSQTHYLPSSSATSTVHLTLSGEESFLLNLPDDNDDPLDPALPVYCGFSAPYYTTEMIISLHGNTTVMELKEGIPDDFTLSSDNTLTYSILLDTQQEAGETAFIMLNLTDGHGQADPKIRACITTEIVDSCDGIDGSITVSNSQPVLIGTYETDGMEQLYVILDSKYLDEDASYSILAGYYVESIPRYQDEISISFSEDYTHPEYIYIETLESTTLHVECNITSDMLVQLQRLTMLLCPDYPRTVSTSTDDCYTVSVSQQQTDPVEFHIACDDDCSTTEWWLSITPTSFPTGTVAGITITSDVLLENGRPTRITVDQDTEVNVPISINVGTVPANSFVLLEIESTMDVDVCFSTLYAFPEDGECDSTAFFEGDNEEHFEVFDLQTAWVDGYVFMTLTSDEDFASYTNTISITSDLLLNYELNESHEFDMLLLRSEFFYFDYSGSSNVDNMDLVISPPTTDSEGNLPSYFNSSGVEIGISASNVSPDESMNDFIVNEGGVIVYPIGDYLSIISEDDLTGALSVRVTATAIGMEPQEFHIELSDSDTYSDIHHIYPGDMIEYSIDGPGEYSYFRAVPRDEVGMTTSNVGKIIVSPCVGAPTIYSNYLSPLPTSMSYIEQYGYDNNGVHDYDMHDIELEFDPDMNNYFSIYYMNGDNSDTFSFEVYSGDAVYCRPTPSINTDLTVVDCNNVNDTTSLTIGFNMADVPDGCNVDHDGVQYALYAVKEEDVDTLTGASFTACGMEVAGTPLWINPDDGSVWDYFGNNTAGMTIASNVEFDWDSRFYVNIVAKLLGQDYTMSYTSILVDTDDWKNVDDGISKTFELTFVDDEINVYFYPEPLTDGSYLGNSVFDIRILQDGTTRTDVPLNICISNSTDSCPVWSAKTFTVPSLDDMSAEYAGRNFLSISTPDHGRSVIQISADDVALSSGDSISFVVFGSSFAEIHDGETIQMEEDRFSESIHLLRATIDENEDAIFTLTTDSDESLGGSIIETVYCFDYPPDDIYEDLPDGCYLGPVVYPQEDDESSVTFNLLISEDETLSAGDWWLGIRPQNLPEDHPWTVSMYVDTVLQVDTLEAVDLQISEDNPAYIRIEIPSSNSGDLLGIIASCSKANLEVCFSYSTSHPSIDAGECDYSQTVGSMGASELVVEVQRQLGQVSYYASIYVASNPDGYETLDVNLNIDFSALHWADYNETFHVADDSLTHFHYDTSDVAKEDGSFISLTISPPEGADESYYTDGPFYALWADTGAPFPDLYHSEFYVCNKGIAVLDVDASILGDALYFGVTPLEAMPSSGLDFVVMLETEKSDREAELNDYGVYPASDEPLTVNEQRFFSYYFSDFGETVVFSPCKGTPVMYVDYRTPYPDAADVNATVIRGGFGEELSFASSSGDLVELNYFFGVFSASTEDATSTYAYEIYPGTSQNRPSLSDRSVEVTEVSKTSVTLRFAAAAASTAAASGAEISYGVYGFENGADANEENDPVRSTACGAEQYGMDMLAASKERGARASKNYVEITTTAEPEKEMDIVVVASYSYGGSRYAIAYEPVSVTFKNKSTWWIVLVVILGVIVLAGIGFGVYYYLRHRSHGHSYEGILDHEDTPMSSIR
eukprot:gnl/Chilomastix_cuspidata/129.p1 GENE.gnl/Chilomastix_cuspidata/129~~gnl/Chilomastix_cuspidata/129.p1  ORF type:complete len:2119 (-),score=638.22 gnl/Chilomastix_cuspidata/129:781-7137(-)